MRPTAVLAVASSACMLGVISTPSAVAGQVGDQTDVSFGPVSAEKLDHYVKGYNFLVGTFGLAAEYRLYAAQQVGRRSASDAVGVSDGWLEQADDELRQGYNKQGGTVPELDRAAGRMIAVLDRLVERLKGLEAYYQTRGNLLDGLARGKREDRLVLADFATATADLPALNVAVETAIDRRDTANLQALKESGDPIGFDGELSLKMAKSLLAVFGRPGSLRDPASIARGDKLAAGMTQVLDDEEQHFAAAKARGDDSSSLRNSNFHTAAGELRGMVGTYRDMTRTGNATLYRLMVGAYDDAIQNVNIGR